MFTCQEIYTQTDSAPISVELTERRWTLLGHILRLDPETPENKAMVQAMVQYFRMTIDGIKRTSYAGAQRTSIMTMMRDEYRSYTNDKMKQIVGTPHFNHGADLDKLRGIAQDNRKWADLVNHITNIMGVSWVRSNCTRKQQEVPWSSTPIIRVRPADARIPRRAALLDIYHDYDLRRDIIIRGYIIDINIQIFLRDTRYRRGAREVAWMRRAIEASTSCRAKLCI